MAGISLSSPKQLVRPGSPVDDFMPRPIKHPLLVKILAETNPPSPCRLVHDEDQPLHGVISNKISRLSVKEAAQKWSGLVSQDSSSNIPRVVPSLRIGTSPLMQRRQKLNNLK